MKEKIGLEEEPLKSQDGSGERKNLLQEMHAESDLTWQEKKLGRNYRQIMISVLSAVGLFLVIDHVFYWNLLGKMELQTSYSYLLMAIYFSTTFIIYPINKSNKGVGIGLIKIDKVIFIPVAVICVYLAINGYDILMQGLAAAAPTYMVVLCFIIWLAILEGTRRTGGMVLAIVVTLFSFYPLFAEHFPGLLQGAAFDFSSVVSYHIMSTDSALGIPMTVVGNILIGYIIFGVVLMVTGGGDFFLKLSMALLGDRRGGVAKVAVLASGFFGSLSGSAVSNVITTGSITIPMMKKTGYEPHFAGAVEAVASNGGQLMPPVMGAVAFVMASFLNISYREVAAAAAVPSFLYYYGLMLQVDGHAVKNGLRGLPRNELPSIREALRGGWFYLLGMIILVVFLFEVSETQAPFYASAFLILAANVRKETRLSLRTVNEFFYRLAAMLSQLVPILCAVGMVIGSLALTGVAHAFPSEILRLAGSNLVLMLILGAAAAFVLGMGMTAIAVYVFLAVILAPALVELGLDRLAVHMFILYWGLLSFITPPVCIAVYPAAAIAGAKPMRTGVTAVRLGAVAFIIPFFFVLNPSLVLEGSFFIIVTSVCTAIIGIFLLASSLEGYMIGLGNITVGGGRMKHVLSYAIRGGFFVSGFLITFPGFYTDFLGFLIGAPLILLTLRMKRKVMGVSVETLV
jgi:TRAP transporter 4TM/12TM fusion protein